MYSRRIRYDESWYGVIYVQLESEALTRRLGAADIEYDRLNEFSSLSV
jgi:hypothetical protein